MARRFLLQTQMPTSSGKGTYNHICIVAEYGDAWAGYSDAQLRKKFRDKYRNVERGNPTRFITMETVSEGGWHHGI